MVRRAGLLAVIWLSVSLSVAGCGGGTPPAEWATEVCAALGPWRAQIVDLNARTQRDMSAAATPAQTRANLLALFTGAELASERARAAVAAAGTPDVAGGDQVADRFLGSIEGVRDAYARARGELEALPTDDPEAFYDGVVVVLDRLNRAYAESAIDPEELDSPELGRSFDEAEKCR